MSGGFYRDAEKRQAIPTMRSLSGNSTIDREVWGILGGLGPLASTEFLATIYEHADASEEQSLPAVLLFSDPAVPDRTEALLRGCEDQLAAEVSWRANRLLAAGATKLVFCCVSLHPIVGLLPVLVQRNLISLVDVIIDSLEQSRGPHLMLCTEGTRKTELFQQHEHWNRVQSRVIFPDDADQRAIHALIYRIKKREASEQQIDLIARLMGSYGVNSFIAGCTEMHILAKRCNHRQDAGSKLSCIDPLTILASRIAGTRGHCANAGR